MVIAHKLTAILYDDATCYADMLSIKLVITNQS
jgi:hypothetical protein